jgi:hypothetical protein
MAGNRIVVLVHARVRPKGSNHGQDVSLADVYTLRNGRVVEMQAFAGRREPCAGLERKQSEFGEP